MYESEAEPQIVVDGLSEDEAVEAAQIEVDCEDESQDGVPSGDADDFSSIEDDDLEGRLSIGQLLKPGGGFSGSEAPVRRAIQIGTANGLTVTSTKRSGLSSTSDHHVSQRRAFAADLSNGSSPTPQMDRTAREIATVLGHPDFRAGVLSVTHGSARVQLLWRTNVGGNHFNHVHFGVRMGVGGGGGRGASVTSSFPQLTQPNMRGDETRKIQQRLVALGSSVGSAGPDGVFGPATDSAVRQFQKSNGIAADGVVGPTTRTALG
jgi:hypothetical protein